MKGSRRPFLLTHQFPKLATRRHRKLPVKSMPQIVVRNLVKTFRVAERKAGLGGAFAGLVKRTYRTVRALDGVSFSIDRGALIGYIGPNGAGKSTTVKILSGILVPDSGTCEVDGRIPWKHRIEHVGRIGVVFGQRTQLWWDLPVIESFDLLQQIYRIPDSEYKRTRDELVGLMKVGSFLDVPVRQLSLGQRMRCDLVAALLHKPQILFLDEPTIGLDALSKLAVRDFVLALNQQHRVTVILTTHDMDDIEALCSRIVVIGNGKILSDGLLDELRAMVGSERRLIIDLVQENEQVSDPKARIVRREGHRVHLSFDPAQVSSADLVRRIMSRYAVRDLFVENPPIEEIIARYYTIEKETGT